MAGWQDDLLSRIPGMAGGGLAGLLPGGQFLGAGQAGAGYGMQQLAGRNPQQDYGGQSGAGGGGRPNLPVPQYGQGYGGTAGGFPGLGAGASVPSSVNPLQYAGGGGGVGGGTGGYSGLRDVPSPLYDAKDLVTQAMALRGLHPLTSLAGQTLMSKATEIVLQALMNDPTIVGNRERYTGAINTLVAGLLRGEKLFGGGREKAAALEKYAREGAVDPQNTGAVEILESILGNKENTNLLYNLAVGGGMSKQGRAALLAQQETAGVPFERGLREQPENPSYTSLLRYLLQGGPGAGGGQSSISTGGY